MIFSVGSLEYLPTLVALLRVNLQCTGHSETASRRVEDVPRGGPILQRPDETSLQNPRGDEEWHPAR